MLVLSFIDLIKDIILLTFSVFGGPVTELPFGMQPAIDTFAEIIHSVLVMLPFMEVIYTLVIWAIGLKIMFVSISLVMWIIERIK